MIPTKTTSTSSCVQPRTVSSFSTNTDTEAHWKIRKSHMSYARGLVSCPHRNHSTTQFSYYHIEEHISKFHPEILNIARRCPLCQESVLPSMVESHMSFCAYTYTDTEARWHIRKYLKRGLVLCPHRSHTTNFLYCHIEEHISRFHPEMLNIPRLCPVCRESVLPSMVESHMSICAPKGSPLCRSVLNTVNKSVSSVATAVSVTP